MLGLLVTHCKCMWPTMGWTNLALTLERTAAITVTQLCTYTQARSIITPCPVGPVSLIFPLGDEGSEGGGTLGGSASGLLPRGLYRLSCSLEGEMSPGRAY